MRKSIILLTFLFILVISPFAWALTDTKEVDILIDLTPPEISILGVEDGGIYSSTIAPIVSAADNNGVVNLDITLSRYNQYISWHSGQEIAEYGSYILSVIATDKAGNRAEKTMTFTLNTAGEPIIRIDKEKYNTGETMTVTVTDLNKTGQGSIEVIGYGIQSNPKIICAETTPGTFVGKHTFSKGILSGGFYVRYFYGDNKYIEANGYYDVSDKSGAGGINLPEKLTEESKEDLGNPPGTIIDKVTDNEVKTPSGDTAIFRRNANGEYVYVPTIYDPNTRKHIILNKEEGEELLLIQLTSRNNQEWVAPARDWLEQRRLISDTKSDHITKNEVARLLENTTGSPRGVLPADTTPVTVAEMNEMITQVLNISPLGKYVDRKEIDKWAEDRQQVNKPVTRKEVLVTTYWFLQNVK